VSVRGLSTIFWLSASLIIYVYFGYPLLLAVFSRPRRVDFARVSDVLPHVTMLISAYNEKGVIEEKLRNCLSLDYPRELLTLVVVSDCSDDGTDEIVLRYVPQGVRLVRSSQRVGKSAGLNLGVNHASGNILVFSDANAMYNRDAIRLLIRHFSNPEVGYVVGSARYAQSRSQTPSAESEGLYWQLETWLKRKESDFASVVGGDGAIYAIRRKFYVPLRVTDINDFLNPLQIIVRGYRGVYETSAICYEEAGQTFEKEFRRKVRIVSRSLNALGRAPRVLLPWNQPKHWVALISHKLLRWFAPMFLLAALAASLFLWPRPFYRIAAYSQMGFYLLAVIGWVLQSRPDAPRFLYLPYYFVSVNLASLFGLFKCFTGSLSATWQTARQDYPSKRDRSLWLARRKL
jgi:cellulose synthase/poly-beta-1,6-N-acetylglucosamine synthase-like glycosyltransferase